MNADLNAGRVDAGCFDAILFDLGGVVLDIDFRRALAHWAGEASLDVALLRTRFSQDETGRRYETGQMTDSAFFESLRTSLGIDLSPEAMLDGWNAIFVGEMPGVSQALASAAKRLPLYAFSNTNPAHQAYFSKHFPGVLGHFRQVFTFSDIGMRKPDAAAYQFVVNAIGASAERILFFDDLKENVESARACGLTAVHVTARTTVADTLAKLGL